MKEIYMDNSATTPLCDAAKQAIIDGFDTFGNPSSLHSLGHTAEKAVEKARDTVLDALGDKDGGKFVFTGSGSEANNLAFFGTAYAKKSNFGKKIIITDSEHPSVTNCAEELAERGFRLVKIPTVGGVVDRSALLDEVDEKTFLVSIMTVNNETGAEYDIKQLCALCKKKNPDIIFHTDAVQAFMKTDISVKKTGVDLLSVSGHKIGAPKGIGGLYISAAALKKRALRPHIFGGGQEYGFRSGTENTLLIRAFAAAVKHGKENLSKNIDYMNDLRCQIIEKLSGLDGVRVNIPSGKCSPSIISVTVFGVKSEVMLHHLSSYGVFVSSGSACSSNHPGTSSAMTAFGISPDESDSTVRISISPNNTSEDGDILISSLENGIKNLAKKISRK